MLEPKGYRLLVKQLPQEKETESGLILHSETEQQRQQRGYNICEVISMGSACYKDRADGADFNEGAWCSIGDKVYISNYAGKMIEPDELMGFVGESEKQGLVDMKKLNLSYHLINDEDVMGVIV